MKNVKEKESKSQRNIFSIAYPEYQSLNNLHELPQVLYSNKQFNCTDGEKEIKTQNNQYSQDTSYNNGSTLIDKSYGKLNQQYDFQSKSLNPYSLDLTHVQVELSVRIYIGIFDKEFL